MFSSCSSKEEELQPSYNDVNLFEPTAGDHSQTAEIRRNFYKATGTYLLFNDTLEHSAKPQLLGLNYAILGDNNLSYDYTFKYVTNPVRQQLYADFVKNHVVPKLGRLNPFSYLIVDEISYIDYGGPSTTTYLNGVRALVLSMDNGEAVNNPESYTTKFLASYVKTKLKTKGSALLEPFYAYSNAYYGKDLSEFNWESLTTQQIWDLGMFKYYSPKRNPYFAFASNDLNLWIDAVLKLSYEEFREQYGSSATMMAKYATLQNILSQLGLSLH